MSGFNDERDDVSSSHDDERMVWPTPVPPPHDWAPPVATASAAPADGRTEWQEQAAPASTTTRRMHRGLRIAAASIVVVAAVLLGVGLGHAVWTTSKATAQGPFGGFLPGGQNGVTDPNFSLPTQGSGGPSNAAAIAANVDPGLVDINSTFGYEQASGAGTGIVLTSTGEILTNNHVIDGATAISVTDVGNGKTYKATVVGYDVTQDIAVLQLQGASGLKVATIGDSSKATVGEGVVAIGNAGGAGGTPTSAGGTISGIGQSVTASDSLSGTTESLTGLLEVTANVQPGDSGGPLVNSSGQVLGIDTAGPSGFSMFSAQATSSAGYAIPINEAMSLARSITTGTQTGSLHIGPTAFLGVLITSSGTSSGANVTRVVAGGAAAQAGVVAGDVITSVNGSAISATSSVSKALIPLHPGDTVSIGWTTPAGHHVTGTAVLQSGPPA